MLHTTVKTSPATPKDVQGKVVVVDAANVAFDDATGQASIRRLKLLEAALNATGCSQVIFIADASLRHRLGPADRKQLQSMIESRELYQAPAGTSADEFVIDLARRKDGFMVSNDRYREHTGRWRELQHRLIKFLIIEDEVFLSGIEAEFDKQKTSKRELSDDSIASVIQGRTSSWFDVFVTVPIISLCGGLVIALVWRLSLAGIFAPLYAFGISVLGLSLFGAALSVLVPVALFVTLFIYRWFMRDDSVSGTNARETHLRAYAAVALLIWTSALTMLFLYLALATASAPSWPVTLGLILGTGPALPLIGFIRTAARFRDFTSWLDTTLVVAVCVVAVGWLAAGSAYLYALAWSDADGTDRGFLATIIALLVIQATVVLTLWVITNLNRARA